MVSKEDLLEIKRMNEERRKMNEKRKKLSREENFNKHRSWEDNKPHKAKSKNKEEEPKICNTVNNNSVIKDNKKNNNTGNTRRHLSDPFKKQSILAEDNSNKSIFDEEGNPMDPVAYMTKATGKSYGNTKNYSSKIGEVKENDRLYEKKKTLDVNNVNDLHKICDREWEYVHELQRILFSYFEDDLQKTRNALGKIDDRNGEIFKLFQNELGDINFGGWLDYFHWWRIFSVSNDFESIIDTVVGFHKKLEKVKVEINKKIKNPEDKLPTIYPFYKGIHRDSPRGEK